MSDVIQDLYLGKIAPIQEKAQTTEDFLFHRAKFLELSKTLRESLDEKALSLFEEYSIHSDSLIMMGNEESFRTGFILGGSIFAEVLTSKKTEN